MSHIHKTILSSGIKLITEEMPDVESSSIGVWVKTGSRHEPARLGGISHFIEHLLFKGTAARSALEISRAIESVGGVLNAFTGREYTCFYARVLNKDLPLAIDLLSDIFMNSVFDPAEMERERRVVLQEIKMVRDTPDDLVHDLFSERFWQGDRLGAPILGTTASVRRIRRSEIIAYFDEHYHSKTVFICAAGGLDRHKVAGLLDATFGRVLERGRRRKGKRPVAVPGARFVRKDLEQTHLCLGVGVPCRTREERYRAYLINTILGSGMSSRLFHEIREKRGLAYSVFSYLNLCMDAGSLVAYAGTSSRNFKEVAGLILEAFEWMGTGVGAKDLRNAKEQLKGGMLLGLETSENRMTKLARDEIYYGKTMPVKSIVRGIESVTVDDVRRCAARALRPERVTLVAIGKARRSALPPALKGLG